MNQISKNCSRQWQLLVTQRRIHHVTNLVFSRTFRYSCSKQIIGNRSLLNGNRCFVGGHGGFGTIRLSSTLMTTTNRYNNRINLRQMLLSNHGSARQQQKQIVRKITTNFNTFGIKFDLFSIAFVTVATVYFSIQTFLVNFYYKAFSTDDRTRVIDRKNFEFLLDVVEESHVKNEYKTTELAQFEFSNNFQAFILSSFMSRFGLYIFLPEYFFFNSTEDIDLDKIFYKLQLDRNRMEEPTMLSSVNVTGETMSPIDELKQSLVLSDDAKKFLIFNLMHSASTGYDPFVTTSMIYAFPLISHRLARFISSSNKLVIPAVTFGYLIAGIGCYFAKYLQERYALWATVKYEINQDLDSEQTTTIEEEYNDDFTNRNILDQNKGNKEEEEDKRKRLFNGGMEYLQKSSRLNQLIYNYSKVSRIKSQFSTSGDASNLNVDYKDFYKMLTVYPNHKRIQDLQSYYEMDPKQLTLTRFFFW